MDFDGRSIVGAAEGAKISFVNCEFDGNNLLAPTPDAQGDGGGAGDAAPALITVVPSKQGDPATQVLCPFVLVLFCVHAGGFLKLCCYHVTCAASEAQ